ILPAGFFAGLLHPRAAWRWALVLGLSITIFHLVARMVGYRPPYPVGPNAFGTLMALVKGLAVPAAVAVGMALRLQPARPHFIFLDARAVIPALGAAWLGTWSRRGDRAGGQPEAREERKG